jgi:Ethanolamine utilization protein EutJ (predicted chaperonin)
MGKALKEGKILLALSETYKKDKCGGSGFWSVMSFLTQKEAQVLSEHLRKATRTPGYISLKNKK